jgi:hypothetical protein
LGYFGERNFAFAFIQEIKTMANKTASKTVAIIPKKGHTPPRGGFGENSTASDPFEIDHGEANDNTPSVDTLNGEDRDKVEVITGVAELPIWAQGKFFLSGGKVFATPSYRKELESYCQKIVNDGSLFVKTDGGEFDEAALEAAKAEVSTAADSLRCIAINAFSDTSALDLFLKSLQDEFNFSCASAAGELLELETRGNMMNADKFAERMDEWFVPSAWRAATVQALSIHLTGKTLEHKLDGYLSYRCNQVYKQMEGGSSQPDGNANMALLGARRKRAA